MELHLESGSPILGRSVLSSDILTDIDLSKMLAFHRKNGSKATIALTQTEVPVAFGIVITEEDGRINRFLEKPSWGEVFSDTINTGIYILEPEILKLFEKNQEYDFSKQLFPSLLEKEIPMFGYLGDFYWLDIGTPKKYIQANQDVLSKKVKINFGGKEIQEEVWVGEGNVIDPEAQLWSPVIIGHNCRLEKEAIVDRLSVIGDGVFIGRKANIKRSVVWNNASIREKAKLENCIIASRVDLGAESVVQTEAIIGDDCEIGNDCFIKPNIIIWPNKTIQAGTTVTMNVKGATFVREGLFGNFGIRGLINIEINPEFAAKLGAAFGTMLGPDSKVAIGRDNKNVSRMIKRALIAGLMSTGVAVYNLEIMPLPLIKFAIQAFGATAGVSIKNPLNDINSITIQFFGKDGIDVSRGAETEIEDIFFKERIKRVEPSKVGRISFPVRTFEIYSDSLMKYRNSEIIRKKRPRIVLDCANGSGSIIAPDLFQKLGCELISLNAQLTIEEDMIDFSRYEASLTDLSKTVKALDADIGIALSEDAGRVIFVDNKGEIIEGDTALAVFVKSRLVEDKGGRICVPVSASQVIDQVCAEGNGQLVRCRIGHRPLLEKILNQKCIFGGEEIGGFVFPEFQIARDGMFASAYLIEQIVKREMSLHDIVSDIPKFYMTKKIIPVPYNFRGKVMIALIEEAYEHNISTIDGVKVYYDYGWCLIRPGTDVNTFEIYSEAKNKDEATQLSDHWANIIKETIHFMQTGT